MPKIVRSQLAARACDGLGPGRHHDGEGLFLNVTENGLGRSRVLRLSVGRRRRQLGLGPCPAIPLKAAETDRRLRQRIRTVLEWGRGHGHVTGDGVLAQADHALGRQAGRKAGQQKHHAALPRAEMPGVLARLLAHAGKGELARLALVVLTLTAARSGEVRGARREEIDLEGTPHGMRSAFRDWAAEDTSHPREIAEMALAHSVGNAVERACRRSDLLAGRRALMEDWGRFCVPCTAPEA